METSCWRYYYLVRARYSDAKVGKILSLLRKMGKGVDSAVEDFICSHVPVSIILRSISSHFVLQLSWMITWMDHHPRAFWLNYCTRRTLLYFTSLLVCETILSPSFRDAWADDKVNFLLGGNVTSYPRIN